VSQNICKFCGSSFQGHQGNQNICNNCKNKVEERKCITCERKFTVKVRYDSGRKECLNCILKAAHHLKDREKTCKDCGVNYISKTNTVRCDKCRKIFYDKIMIHSRAVKDKCMKCGKHGIAKGSKYCHGCKVFRLTIDIKKEKPKIPFSYNWGVTIYNDGICEYCKIRKPQSFHHIYPREFGGPTVLENCIPLCNPCHDEVEILTYDLLERKPSFSIDDLRGFILQHNFPNEEVLLEEYSIFKLASPVQEP